MLKIIDLNYRGKLRIFPNTTANEINKLHVYTIIILFALRDDKVIEEFIYILFTHRPYSKWTTHRPFKPVYQIEANM